MSQISIPCSHHILPHHFFIFSSVFWKNSSSFFFTNSCFHLLGHQFCSLAQHTFNNFVISLCGFLSCFVKTTSFFTLLKILKSFPKFSFRACSTLFLKIYLTSEPSASYILSLVSLVSLVSLGCNLFTSSILNSFSL